NPLLEPVEADPLPSARRTDGRSTLQECSDLVSNPSPAPRGLRLALDKRAKPLLTELAVLVDQERRGQAPHAIVAGHHTIFVQEHWQAKAQILATRLDRGTVLLQVDGQ